ncbi:MAG: type II toxin-antitoxin system HicA family toxin [Candidatus Heimdallarchaeota archaeon]
MTKLPTISATKLIRKLLKGGFQDAPKRGKGSHRALIRIDKEGKIRLVIIPKRDPIPKGTLLSIIKQSGLSREEFIKLLK